MEIPEIEQQIKQMTKEPRFLHSKDVQQTARMLAERYGADPEKASLAGLMHDAVKNLPFAEMFRLCEEFGCELDSVTKNEPKLIHAPLGAYYAKFVFGIDDDEIFDAIYYHTTAKADMPLLTKIIYIADVIEPNRNFDGVEDLRKAAFEDIDAAILQAIDFNICKIVHSGRMLHDETVNARNYLIEKGVRI